MIGDVWQVVNEFEYQGNPNSYIWHVQTRVEGAPNLIPAQLEQFGSERQAAWALLHNPSVDFLCITTRQIFPTFSRPRILIEKQSGSATCTPALNHLPGQCSCVVTLYGDVDNPTSRNRGRDFITGQCADDQVNGVWNNGVGSYLESVCEMYRLMGSEIEIGGNTFDVGIYSRSNALPPKVNGVQPPPIEPFFWSLKHVTGRSLVRTQRRRQSEAPCEAVCDAAILPTPIP